MDIKNSQTFLIYSSISFLKTWVKVKPKNPTTSHLIKNAFCLFQVRNGTGRGWGGSQPRGPHSTCCWAGCRREMRFKQLILAFPPAASTLWNSSKFPKAMSNLAFYLRQTKPKKFVRCSSKREMPLFILKNHSEIKGLNFVVLVNN